MVYRVYVAYLMGSPVEYPQSEGIPQNLAWKCPTTHAWHTSWFGRRATNRSSMDGFVPWNVFYGRYVKGLPLDKLWKRP